MAGLFLFKRNFPVSREEIQRSQIVIFENFPKKVKKINFYTERGYLKLAKASWNKRRKIQKVTRQEQYNQGDWRCGNAL